MLVAQDPSAASSRACKTAWYARDCAPSHPARAIGVAPPTSGRDHICGCQRCVVLGFAGWASLWDRVTMRRFIVSEPPTSCWGHVTDGRLYLLIDNAPHLHRLAAV